MAHHGEGVVSSDMAESGLLPTAFFDGAMIAEPGMPAAPSWRIKENRSFTASVLLHVQVQLTRHEVKRVNVTDSSIAIHSPFPEQNGHRRALGAGEFTLHGRFGRGHRYGHVPDASERCDLCAEAAASAAAEPEIADVLLQL